jgi:ribosomal-protein-alanine N-acetyltransferase
MSGETVLRNYRPEDLDAMFRLDEACFAEEFRFNRESIRMYAEERGAIVRIAEKNGEIVGFVIVHVERLVKQPRGYVVTLDVDVKHRRLGVARRLMEEAEARIAAEGAPSMELHVFTKNENAIRFYEQLGYRRIAMSQGFYGNEGLDAFVYRKKLNVV